MKSILERFNEKYIIDQDTECWVWTAYKDDDGYGKFMDAGHCWLAHRWSYKHFTGSIPNGAHCCHNCDNRCCVNPNHLWLGTNQDNINDKVKKQRQAKGETAGLAKLTEQEVLEIRADTRTRKQIAADYGISIKYVTVIKNRKTWKYI